MNSKQKIETNSLVQTQNIIKEDEKLMENPRIDSFFPTFINLKLEFPQSILNISLKPI